MAPNTRWLVLPLALGLGLALTTAASAGEQRSVSSAYHREYRTATRPERSDPSPVARESAWGGQPAPWWEDGDASRSHWWSEHRPDPNRRPVKVPWDGPRSHNGIGWGDWHGRDERARRGWRAGWRGAAPGWGGVWWYGWGGDWPTYADTWEEGRWHQWHGWHDRERGWHHSGWSDGYRGGWHGEFGYGHGWGDGRRVIALPAPRGD
jgi:hypothetical protein